MPPQCIEVGHDSREPLRVSRGKKRECRGRLRTSVAAICAVDTNRGCVRRVVPVKRQRIVHGVHGGEALWAPVGDRGTGVHAGEHQDMWGIHAAA